MTTLGPYAPAANNDDWCNYYDASWQHASDFGGFLAAGRTNNNRVWMGMRFALGAAIPSGATINSATLSVHTYAPTTWGANDYLRIYATQSADAPQVTAASARPDLDSGSTELAAANVRWPASGGWAPGEESWSDSPSIASIIQELVDDYGGLASGAHIVLWIAHGDGGGSGSPDNQYAIHDYEGGSSTRPTLTIVYTAAATVKSVEDSGAGGDAIGQLRAALGISDTGQGTEASPIGAFIPTVDSGHGAEGHSIIARLTIADSGIASDAPGCRIHLSIIDAAAGADALSILAELLRTVSDSGAGADALAASAALAVQDAGQGQESQTIQVWLSILDTGAGADAISLLASVLKSIADLAAGSDALSVAAGVLMTESGHGSAEPSIFVQISQADSGGGVDSVLLTILKAIADAAHGSDSLQVSASIPVAELGFGMENQLIAALLRIADSGAGADQVAISGSGVARVVTVRFGFKKPGVAFALKKPAVRFELLN